MDKRWQRASKRIDTLADTFPYMKFLQVPFTSNLTEFKKQYDLAKPNDTGAGLGQLLNKVMLKRYVMLASLISPSNFQALTRVRVFTGV